MREAKSQEDGYRKPIHNLLFCIVAALTGGTVFFILQQIYPTPVAPGGHSTEGPVLFMYVFMVILMFITVGWLIASAIWTLIFVKKLFATLLRSRRLTD
jgi:hypothetical protein